MIKKQGTFDKNSSIKRAIINEIHKPARRYYNRRTFIQKGINDTLQMDLVEMIPYAKVNKGYKYILMVIDCFSKKAFASALKTKTGKEVTEATKKILESLPYPPKNIQTDLGKEFYNSNFKALMKKYDINHYSTYTEMKASIVERLNRTIKGIMWKEFGLFGDYKWIDRLQSIIETYNSSYHRTIKMAPNEVNTTNEKMILKTAYTVYNKTKIHHKSKYSVGDMVRISKHKGIFNKGYKPNWTTEIFKIIKVQKTYPVTYLLQDESKTIIKGSFYEAELCKAKHPNTYVIEKIIKTKGKKLYVKYLGLDNSHNAWINKKDLY